VKPGTKVKMDTSPPAYGREFGFLYPAIWRLLALNRFFSPSMWVPRNSVIGIDAYLLVCWSIELMSALFVTQWDSWRGVAVCCFLGFRWLDLFFVNVSVLVKGFYRRGEWSSPSRVVLLALFNALELLFLFGMAYWTLFCLSPKACAFDPAPQNLWQGVHFSVVTGTSLGYGSPLPTGWLSRVFTAVETLHVLLVLIAVIAYARSLKEEPGDS